MEVAVTVEEVAMSLVATVVAALAAGQQAADEFQANFESFRAATDCSDFADK